MILIKSSTILIVENYKYPFSLNSAIISEIFELFDLLIILFLWVFTAKELMKSLVAISLGVNPLAISLIICVSHFEKR